MRLTTLGTGTPIPDPARRGPSQVVQSGDDALLIDCGSGVVQQLVAARIDPGSIRNVLITHHHSDHTIDLAHFLFTGWVMGWWKQPPAIYGPPGTAEFVRRLLLAFELDINFRLQAREQPLERLVPVCIDIEAGWVLEGNDWRVAAFGVEHEPVHPAFGFRVESGRRSAVVSDDTHPCESLIRNAMETDLLVHEVYWTAGAEARKQGVSDEASLARMTAIDAYHTGSEELGRVATDCGARALALSHVLFRGGGPEDLLSDVRRDYRGPVTVAEDLMAFDLED